MIFPFGSETDASLWDPEYRKRIDAMTSENLGDVAELRQDLPPFVYAGTQGNYDYAILKMEGDTKLEADEDYTDFISPSEPVASTARVTDCMSLHRLEMDHRPPSTTCSSSADIFAVDSPSTSSHPEPQIWSGYRRFMSSLFDLGKLLARNIHEDPNDQRGWFETPFSVVSVTGPPSKVGFWLLADPEKSHREKIIGSLLSTRHGTYYTADYTWMRLRRSGYLPSSDDKFSYARIRDGGPENVFDYEFAAQNLFVLSPEVCLSE
ncbi:MAG: hypothetical protein Q9165_008637 [Trypethelium subeluteriae]